LVGDDQVEVHGISRVGKWIGTIGAAQTTWGCRTGPCIVIGCSSTARGTAIQLHAATSFAEADIKSGIGRWAWIGYHSGSGCKLAAIGVSDCHAVTA
jgi:hypothetical protein